MFNVFNDLIYELTDVRCALKALERRVDTVERLAQKGQLAESQAAEAIASIAAGIADSGEIKCGQNLETMPVRNSVSANIPDLFATEAPDPESEVASGPILLRTRSYPKLLVAAPASPIKTLMPPIKDGATSKEGLEVFIGRHLNKLGISFLVIGCALALIYQFQYFSPLLKIISGLFGGALLILGGERFEKNNAKLAWYGRALIGGGWALSYFSIFAAHHFPAVRIIESAIIDAGLLLAVACGSVFHSLKYKSETITGLSLTLAFATICLSPATSFSLLSCALLVAALVGLTLKMGWFNLFVYGECIFYAVYLGRILPQIMNGQNAIFGMTAESGNFFTAAAFSTFCWMAMNLVIFSARELSASERQKLVAATLLNGAAFVPTVLYLMSGIHEELKFSFLLSTGLAYLFSTMTAAKLTAPGPTTVHRILGLSLVTMAIPLKLTGDWGPAFWSIEVPVLVWAGLKYEMPSMRRFASVLAFLAASTSTGSILNSRFGFPINDVIFGIVAITAYGASAVFYLNAIKENTIAKRSGFYYYFALSTGIAMALVAIHIAASWVASAYVCGFALIIVIGFRLQDRILRVAGTLGMIMLGAPLFVGHLFASPASSRLSTALIVPAMLYLSHLYRQLEGDTPRLQLAYQTAAATVFTILLGQQFHGVMFEVALAIETIAILMLGFYYRNLSVKIVSLLLSAFIALKFALIDLTYSESISLLGVSMQLTLALGIIGGAALASTSAMYLSTRLRTFSGHSWLKAFYLHGALTALVVGLLTINQAPKEYLALALSLESIVPLIIGMRYQLTALRGIAHVGIIGSQLIYQTMCLNDWNTLATALLIIEQYSLSALFTSLKNDSRYQSEHSIEHYYAVLGTATTSLLLFQQMPSHWLSIALTLQGVAVLSWGFMQKNKVLRVSGLIILGMVIARLLFVELASIETIYRIMSFIGAGIVLLVASLAYARMNEPISR